MKYFKHSSFFFIVLLAICLLSPPLWAAPEGQKKVSLDFAQADIRVFIKFISELTDKNFVIEDQVRGKISVISPQKVTVQEAYKVFESVLEVRGFTTVPAGEVTKIVRAQNARHQAINVGEGKELFLRSQDHMITQVIPLNHVNSQQLRKILKPMVSKRGVLVDYSPTNTLILTDYEDNVQKVLDIIQTVDKEGDQPEVHIYRLEHAQAKRMAETLNNVMEARKKVNKKGKQTPLLYAVPNERMNTVSVLAEKGVLPVVEKLISELDKPTPKGEAKVHVVGLDNAVAVDLAKVLTNLAGGKGEKQKGKPIISENVNIAADKATNSLVITAKQEEFEALQTVIEKLDKPRAQVYVEAAIMEVSTDTELKIGINWQGAFELGEEGVGFGTIGGAVLDPTESTKQMGGSGLSLGILSFPFTFDGETYYNLSSFIEASHSDSQVNIISTPQLMTMENEEAKVVVAQNRPFITSREITEDTDREFSNIEYKDVGVTLKVTPQINEKGSVKMNLFQEVSRVEERVLEEIGAKTPVTRKRTAETRVEVQDGQTAVIAGLIEERSAQTDSGVPGLSQIPGLGWLFKHRDKTGSKKNLMVFITPQVVRSEQDMQGIWSKKMKRMSRLSYGVKGNVQALSAPYEVSGPVQVEVGGEK